MLHPLLHPHPAETWALRYMDALESVEARLFKSNLGLPVGLLCLDVDGGLFCHQDTQVCTQVVEEEPCDTC